MSIIARIVVGVSLILAMLAAIWKVYHTGYTAGETAIMSEWRAESAAAQAKARATEQAIAKQTQEAINAARQRENRQKMDADRARAESVSLRDELAIARNHLPGASCTSIREHAATLNDVFGQCAAQLERLAAAADGHASDSLMLEQAWPTSSKP